MTDLNFTHGLDVTRTDKWLEIAVDESELDGSKISGTGGGSTDEEIEDAVGDGFIDGLVYDDVNGEYHLDEGYAAVWTSQHQFSAGLDTRGDIVDDATVIWDSSAGFIQQTALENDSVTVAGNSVSLGASVAVDHADLSNIGTADHHAKYTDEEAQDAVGTILSADFTYDDAGNAINMDPHATDADAHHAKYTDEEAQDAVGLNVDATLTYDDATPSFGVDLANANTWTANQTFDAIVDANQFDINGSIIAQAVATSGSVTLSSDTATVDTGLSATGATFHLALGVDDPNADVKLSGTLFWDDSAGTYKIEITENVGGVDPTVNYKVIRVD